MTTPPSLWNFACAVYAKAEVKNACLRVQDNHSGNVLVVLWLSWLKHREINLTDNIINTLINFANGEPAAQLKQLRAIRANAPSFFNNASLNIFNKQVIAAELVIEKAVLEFLENGSITDLQAKPNISLNSYLRQLQPLPSRQDIALLSSLRL